jgi:ribosomal protein S18 acetylase RimI-like enzyme
MLSAYIPLLEVLPDFQGRGIGKELTRRLLGALDGLYMVDVVCDEDVAPFYAALGLTRLDAALGLRNRAAV